MSVIAGAIFVPGKRWEDYLSELDMIEVDTEFPEGTWDGIDDARVVAAHYGIVKVASVSARTPLRPKSMLRIEGPESVIMRAFEIAHRRGECLWFVILGED